MTAKHASALALTFGFALALGRDSNAQVFINEIVINPPGSFDSTREYVELLGTPNMKLDGYAFAMVSGTQSKFFPLLSIPPIPSTAAEVDEFFDLDGLSLGRNGILVIGIGQPANYPLSPDSNFVDWNTLWNGPLDVPGKLQNDGSNTAFLLRNRPGETQADPFDPNGPVWVKDANVDLELTTPVFDPVDGVNKDQLGDGKLDQGGLTSYGATMLDMRGKLTLGDLTDDLEIVDEVSYEHDKGWEYQVDGRHADVGVTAGGLKERDVHALGDPQGMNPDALTRVDYRTKGPGWAPAAGGTGQLPSGKNWQDTATEQWIRGEMLQASVGVGPFPPFFYSVAPNVDPNAIQPFVTQTPAWLADGQGADFSFATANYQVMAGLVNPLAVPFIPGDADRDGDCDGDDVTALRARFGDAEWIFSNGFSGCPEGTSTDPATQVRPWNVDTTGDNGVECSDLQWALNFQGNANGRITGVVYDSTLQPEAAGVALDDPGSTLVTLTATASSPCGSPLGALRINDSVLITVRAKVTAGAQLQAGHENGIQQFVNDLVLTSGGVLAVQSVSVAAPFQKTRASVETLVSGGQGGILSINGFTTQFTRGLSAFDALYTVRLKAVGAGSTNLLISAATAERFANGTPRGLKVGHMADNGNPGAVAYPSLLSFTVTSAVAGSIDEFAAGCIGSGGFTPKMHLEGCATPGGSITIVLEQGKPGAVPNLFLGFGTIAANLNPHCQIAILPLLPTPTVLPGLLGTGNGNGQLTIPGLSIPPTAPLGAVVNLQTLFADPAGFGGIAATNAVGLTIGS